MARVRSSPGTLDPNLFAAFDGLFHILKEKDAQAGLGRAKGE